MNSDDCFKNWRYESASTYLRALLLGEELPYWTAPDIVEQLAEQMLYWDDDPVIVYGAVFAACLYDFDQNVLPMEQRECVARWVEGAVRYGRLSHYTIAAATISPILHQALQVSSGRRVRVDPGKRRRAMELAAVIAAGKISDDQ